MLIQKGVPTVPLHPSSSRGHTFYIFYTPIFAPSSRKLYLCTKIRKKDEKDYRFSMPMLHHRNAGGSTDLDRYLGYSTTNRGEELYAL